ncbi:MAG: hypothetical protein IPM77_05620 [Crocinitomicaceae bacterium]|nr:hypothetical protein [Crocinitomicaceae bacterium]
MNDVIWNSIQMNGSYYSAEPIQMDIPGTNLIAECKFHSTFRMQLTITGDGKKMFENFYSPFQTDISFHGDIAVRIGAGKMALLVCFDLIHDRVGTVSSTMFIYDLKNFQLKWTGSVYAGSIYESDELIAFVLDQQNQKKYVVLDINQPEKISELVSHPLKQVTEKKDVEAGIKDTNLSATELKKNHEYAQKQKENQKEIKNTIASPESHQLINEQACTELENSRKVFAFRITRNKKLRFVFLIIAFTGMALLHPFFGEKLGFDSSFMMIIALVLIITGSIVFIILNYQLRNKLTIPVAENIKLNREVIAPVLNRQFDSAQLIEKIFRLNIYLRILFSNLLTFLFTEL